jgi:hypothetical protein
VIEPRGTRYRYRLAGPRDDAPHFEMRQAVVIARRLARRTLPAVAVTALLERRLRGIEGELERKLSGRDPGLVGCAGLLQHPAVYPDPCAAHFRIRQVEAGTRRPLGMNQAPQRWIGERGMSNQDLAWRESARVVVLEIRPGAKERDLEADRRGGLVEPAGDVPPLDPEIRVAPLVPGKLHLVARHHLRERRDR